MPQTIRSLLVSHCVAALLVVSGCASYGPKTLNSDQLDYGHSIGNTWKNQMLANLVKIRFIDMPVFMDVGQIVSGYTIETKISGGLGFSNSLVGGDSQVLGAEGRFTDRPTITYTPKTGEEYLRSLLDPIEPAALLSLVLADYNAKLLFTWAVQSINGIENYASREDDHHTVSPQYREFVDLMHELQQAGLVGFKLDKDPTTGHDLVLFFNNEGLDDAGRRKLRRARELIGLKEGTQKYHILYSPFALGGDVLAIQTRSIMQILIAMSKFVDVPEDKSARALAGFVLPEGVDRPFHVRSSSEEPGDVFASFRYQGDWYWIDHDDRVSKRVFLLMLFLTTLTNRVTDDKVPVLTIPTS